MDPEANLKEQIAIANEILVVMVEQIVRLAELVIALDEWNAKK